MKDWVFPLICGAALGWLLRGALYQVTHPPSLQDDIRAGRVIETGPAKGPLKFVDDSALRLLGRPVGN